MISIEIKNPEDVQSALREIERQLSGFRLDLAQHIASPLLVKGSDSFIASKALLIDLCGVQLMKIQMYARAILDKKKGG